MGIDPEKDLEFYRCGAERDAMHAHMREAQRAEMVLYAQTLRDRDMITQHAYERALSKIDAWGRNV